MGVHADPGRNDLPLGVRIDERRPDRSDLVRVVQADSPSAVVRPAGTEHELKLIRAPDMWHGRDYLYTFQISTDLF